MATATRSSTAGPTAPAASVSDYNFRNTMGTVPAVSTMSLAITESAYSSFATPAIVVPFPSQYGRQIQLAYTFTNAPVYTRTPNTIGGVEATSGYASMLAEASMTGAPSSGEGGVSEGSGGGFHWPTWATAVVAGVGGAIIIVLLVACCCWRKRSQRKKREKYQRKIVNSKIVAGAAGARRNSRTRDGDKAGMFTEKPARRRDGRERIPSGVASSRNSPKIGSNAAKYDYPSADYPEPPPMIDTRGVVTHGSPSRRNQGGYNVHPDSNAGRPLDAAAYGPLPTHAGLDWSDHRRNISGTSDDPGYITPDDGSYGGSRSSLNGSPAALLANAAPVRPARSPRRHSGREYGAVGRLMEQEWDQSPNSRHRSLPAALQPGRTGKDGHHSDSGHAQLGSAMMTASDDNEDDDESHNRLRVDTSDTSRSRSPISPTGSGSGSDSLGPPPSNERSSFDRRSFETSRSNISTGASRSKAVDSRRSKSIRRGESPS